MPVLLKAIYKQGLFEPVEKIENLTENQEVQLQLWTEPFLGNGADSKSAVAHLSAKEEAEGFSEEGSSAPDDWFLEAEEEWEKLSEWEREGIQPPLTPEEIEERVKWVRNNWGSLALPSDLALEIATADWIAEESWDL